jgi:hypothetical protein
VVSGIPIVTAMLGLAGCSDEKPIPVGLFRMTDYDFIVVPECYRDARLEVDERAGEVVLRAYGRGDADDCLIWQRGCLQEPLGSRLLIDGFDGEAATVIDGPPDFDPGARPECPPA